MDLRVFKNYRIKKHPDTAASEKNCNDIGIRKFEFVA